MEMFRQSANSGSMIPLKVKAKEKAGLNPQSGPENRANASEITYTFLRGILKVRTLLKTFTIFRRPRGLV
jgi:hypothetical protein